MDLHSFFDRGEHQDKYPDVSIEKQNNAKKYLNLVAEGQIKRINLSPPEAKSMLVEFESGKMPAYVIEAHSADYLDYINGQITE